MFSFSPYSLEYDPPKLVGRSTKIHMDPNNNPAPILLLSKKIDGTYYVAEAVADNKWKKIWVESVFKNKKGVTQVPHANMTLGNTSETSLTSPPKNNVPRAEAEVNTIHEETAVSKPKEYDPPKLVGRSTRPLSTLSIL